MNLLTKQEETHDSENELIWLLSIWDWHVHTAILKMDNQQGPIAQHMVLCSMLCGSLRGGENGCMDTYGWVPLLCTWDDYSIVNQLQANI